MLGAGIITPLIRQSIMENGLLLKVLQENSDVKTNSGSISIPCIPLTAWRVFPSQNILSLFNYGHVHYYALESIQNVADNPEDIEDRRHLCHILSCAEP